MRSLKDSLHAVIDLGVVLGIGIAFVAMLIIGYIVYTLNTEVLTTRPSYTNANNLTNANINNSVANITAGWDSGVNLLIVAVTIFILALAISALLMLRGRQ